MEGLVDWMVGINFPKAFCYDVPNAAVEPLEEGGVEVIDGDAIVR